jgi:hypothetical protein
MTKRWMIIAVVAACSGSDDMMGDDAIDQCPQQLFDGSSCPVEGMSCPIEGTGTCSQPPAGGSCSCVSGAWTCYEACPGGCNATQPADGDGCVGIEGMTCPYGTRGGADAVDCTCISGTFDCEPSP